jgi:hypothetical protein
MITRHNPTQLHNPPGYHHVTVVEAGRLAFLAGQCPLTLSVIGSAFTTASTLLGVTRLGFSGQLVEVDLTAAL